jgi:hypothetical protein
MKENKKILQKLGLATVLMFSAENLLGYLIKSNCPLYEINKDLVDELINNKSFENKIWFADKFVKDKKILSKLSSLVRKLDLIMYGINPEILKRKNILYANNKDDKITTKDLEVIIKDIKLVTEKMLK